MRREEIVDQYRFANTLFPERKKERDEPLLPVAFGIGFAEADASSLSKTVTIDHPCSKGDACTFGDGLVSFLSPLAIGKRGLREARFARPIDEGDGKRRVLLLVSSKRNESSIFLRRNESFFLLPKIALLDLVTFADR